MARSEYVYLQGKTKWFRHQGADQWGNYAHVLWLDPSSVKKFQELQESKDGINGIKNTIQKDEDGYYVTLRRPSEKEMKNGRKLTFRPPEVLDGSKTLPDGSNPPLPPEVRVGNGSDVTTKISVYTFTPPVGKNKGKAIRWESSRIDNLIPYSGTTDLDKYETRQVKGLSEQPPQQAF